MEISRKIEGAIFLFKERRKANKERERIERIDNHPHTPDCTRSGDIKTFETSVSYVGNNYYQPVFHIDKTQCTECGEIKDCRIK